MIPLAGLVATALMFVQIDLSVTDTQYDVASGQDVQTVIGNRTIKAGVGPSGGKRLENMFGGNVSAGDIAITTLDELYIGDIYQVGYENQRQSFVTYNGLRYRVVDLSPWGIQTGVNVYRASRHVTQDIV